MKLAAPSVPQRLRDAVTRAFPEHDWRFDGGARGALGRLAGRRLVSWDGAGATGLCLTPGPLRPGALGHGMQSFVLTGDGRDSPLPLPLPLPEGLAGAARPGEVTRLDPGGLAGWIARQRGPICLLVGAPLALPPAERMRLHRAGHALIDGRDAPRARLAQAAALLTDDAAAALIARRAGLSVGLVLPEGALSRAVLDGSTLPGTLRAVDAASGDPLDDGAIRDRLAWALGPGSAARARPPAALLVGRPRGLRARTALPGVIEAPEGFGPEAARDPRLAGVDLLLAPDEAHPGWLGTTGATVRLVTPAPMGIPFGLAQAGGLAPLFLRLRVRGAPEGGGLAYDPGSDLEALSDEDRAACAELGRRLRPALRRALPRWRPRRADPFEMTRKLGQTEVPRILLIGAEPAPPPGVHTNPFGLSDAALARRLLAARPEARLTYLPHPEAPGTAAQAVTALGDRVEIAPEDSSVAELAPLVEQAHTIDALAGLWALICGLALSVHGAPAYAGLGLTRDLDPQGRIRPCLLSRAPDLDTFLGWLMRHAALCIDPDNGRVTEPKTFCRDWLPARGELRAEVTERLVQRAERAAPPAFRIGLVRVLMAQGATGALARALALAPRATIPDAATLAEAQAMLGQWEAGIETLTDALARHPAAQGDVAAAAAVRLRASLRDEADVPRFAARLARGAAPLPAAQRARLAQTLQDRGYPSAALPLLETLGTPEAQAAQVACHAAVGAFDAARAALEPLPEGSPARRAAEIDLAEATGDWHGAVRLLKDRLARDDRPETRLRLGRAQSAAGLLQQAVDTLAPLARGRGHEAAEAARSLAAIELDRMRPEAALAALAPHRTEPARDSAILRLAGEAHAFANRREEACRQFARALDLSPLDVPAQARLREMEEELSDAVPMARPWTTRFRASLAGVEEPSVETLLAEGRAGLLANDLRTMRRNARRALRLFPADLRPHVWLAHALAWDPAPRSDARRAAVRDHYGAALTGGAETNWWTAYDAVRGLAQLGERAALRALIETRAGLLRHRHGPRTGWVRLMAGAALSDLGLAFEGLRDYPRQTMIARHAHRFRLARSLDEIRPDERVLFLSEGGVGDEIRFALLYPELAQHFPQAVFSVDSRLETLFRRSFPQVARFVPVTRRHRTRIHAGLLEDVGVLPDRLLAQFFDNALWAEAEAADVVLPVPCAMADLRPDLNAFLRVPEPRLVADPARVAAWRDRLAPHAGKLLVGMIGTSMFREYQRAGSYFSLDEMAEVFRTPGLAFVSLDYSDAEALGREMRARFGAEVIDLPELDRRDDFEAVLALAHALDCTLGVNTATVELTGFGGARTLFAAPNAQHAWRGLRGDGRDLFFPAIETILGNEPAGKRRLAADIARRLTESAARKREGAL